VIFLGPLRAEVHAASWFAALGEPLTDGDRADANSYASTEDVALVTSWREAELYPKRALWTSLTELTTETGDLVHGKAAMAAARMGGAAPASIHVAAGAAAQAVYQLAVARVAGETASLFEGEAKSSSVRILVIIFN
jgi:hypothetical protein